MKKTLPSMLALFLFMTVTISFAQDEESMAEAQAYDALDISGQITHGEDAIEEVLVELFEGNKIVDAFETKKNGKFKFTLISHHIYTIQLSKKGYYTKRISVNTNMPAEVDEVFKFEFDINIDSMEEKNFDDYLVEYPSALISYQKKKNEYAFDKNYTKSYFEEIEVSEE